VSYRTLIERLTGRLCGVNAVKLQLRQNKPRQVTAATASTAVAANTASMTLKRLSVKGRRTEPTDPTCFTLSSAITSAATGTPLTSSNTCSSSPTAFETVTGEDPEEFVEGWIEYVRDSACDNYNPISIWKDSEHYVEMWVEKIDLKSLFSDICKRYTIPLINIRGRTCLNSRAGTMRRFMQRARQGKQCVLLYCGDHDPSGLQISKEIRSDMDSMTGATEYSLVGLIIDRFGLNADFIDREIPQSWTDNLITSSGENLADPDHEDHNKPYVQHYLRQFGARKVEANALVVRPEAGRQLCLDAIRRYISDELLSDFEARRSAARQEARAAVARLLAQ
jgi:hypothetical protein